MTNPIAIEVYGKEGCDVCSRYKDRIAKMGCTYTSLDINEYINHTEDWRTKGSCEVSAALYILNDGAYPVIKINGEFYTFAKSITKIKELQNGSKQ